MDEIRIFISYAREDEKRIDEIYLRLAKEGFKPWLDRRDIEPGMQWEPTIKKALKESDFVLVCLSATSINKRGFLQLEIKEALEKAKEKLEDDVYLIPARLDNCLLPDALSKIQWVDLFEGDGWNRILKAIEHGLKQRGKTMPTPNSTARTEPVASPLFPSVANPPIETARSDSTHKSFTDNLKGVPLEMIFAPSGRFKMGSAQFWRFDEKPQHDVTVPGFYVGKYQITHAQWEAVMGHNPSYFKGDPALPVENVSWGEAKEFCEKISRITSRGYRLPSEAEWEYACRAGTTGDYAGDLDSMAWYSTNSGYKTHPVGRKHPNYFGLYDMHGNVDEWCEDKWHSHYDGAPIDGSAWLKEEIIVWGPSPKGYYGTQRFSDIRQTVRGGSWSSPGRHCRSAYRKGREPTDRKNTIGFRVVASARTS